MSINQRVAKSTLIIITFGLVSRLLSFIKEILIASKIGCCFETDAYFIAFIAATLLMEIIGEGISTSMVPVLLKIEAREGKEKKVDYINNLLHLVILFSIVLITLGWFLSPAIIRIFAKGFKRDEFDLAVELTKIGLPVILFIGIRAVFVGFLQSNHGFKAGAKSWIYYNIVYIIFLIYFNKYGTHGLMIAGVLAVASQLLSVIPASKNMGYKYERKLDFKDKYLREAFIMVMPIIIALAINRVNVVVDKTIASTLATGSISELNYADDIIQLILGIFITAIVTVVFPILSEEYHKGNVESLKNIMNYGINLILVITVPAMVVLITLSEPLVKLLFERGEFGPRATYMTSQALIYYALGLGSMALVLILIKVYYAIHDTITPMKYGIIAVVTNLVLDIILSKYMGHKGLALATSISTIIVTVLLINHLKNRLGATDIHRSMKILGKLLIAAAVMAAVVLWTFSTLGKTLTDSMFNNVIGVVTSIVVGVMVYVGMLNVMKVR